MGDGSSRQDKNVQSTDHVEISTQSLCALAGVTPATLSAWQRRGLIAKNGRNRWPMKATVQALVKHYRETAEARTEADGGLDLKAEKARLAREQADGLQLKNDELRRKLLPAEEVDTAWKAFCGLARFRLQQATASAVAKITGLSDPQAIRQLLEEEIHAALADLSGTPRAEAGEDVRHD